MSDVTRIQNVPIIGKLPNPFCMAIIICIWSNPGAKPVAGNVPPMPSAGAAPESSGFASSAFSSPSFASALSLWTSSESRPRRTKSVVELASGSPASPLRGAWSWSLSAKDIVVVGIWSGLQNRLRPSPPGRPLPPRGLFPRPPAVQALPLQQSAPPPAAAVPPHPHPPQPPPPKQPAAPPHPGQDRQA